MKQLPNATAQVFEYIAWSVKLNLALKSDVMKTYGVFNMQLRELNNCAIKKILVKEQTYGYEHEIKIMLNKDFVKNKNREELENNLNEFIQEYLGLNKLVIGSFNTNFIEAIPSLQKFMLENPTVEVEQEKIDLIEVLKKRRM